MSKKRIRVKSTFDLWVSEKLYERIQNQDELNMFVNTACYRNNVGQLREASMTEVIEVNPDE